MPKHKNSKHNEIEPDLGHDEPDEKEDTVEIESFSAEPSDQSNTNKKNEEKSEIQKLEEKIKTLEELLEKEKKEQLYIRADFDTYKRRAIKERSDMLKYSGERIFVGLLGILDNFERALQTDVKPDNIESFRSGVKLISDEIKNLLKREGVEEVLPKDDQFDPNIFEAISSEESSEKDPGQITQIFRKAYRLFDRVIRPGQAVVARAPKDLSEEIAEDGQQDE